MASKFEHVKAQLEDFKRNNIYRRLVTTHVRENDFYLNGKKVINFSVAHSETYKDGEGVTVENTTWVECGFWSEKTRIAPYLKKGTKVYVEGTPTVSAYETKDRKPGASLRLSVLRIELLGSSDKDNNGSNTPAPDAGLPGDGVKDDLPF